MQQSQINNTSSEIARWLSLILRQCEKLRAQANPAQVFALDEIADYVARIEDESRRSQPKNKHYQFYIEALLEAAKELDAMGLPIVATVEGLRELLI